MRFHWGSRTYIMGILNATPDSFSGDGLWPNVDALVAKGLRMLEEGADILDVGGESTRPGSHPVSAEEELERVLPVVRALVAAGGLVSIDTQKALVAEAALRVGARMVNDVSGLAHDPELASVVARHGAWLVLMHNRKAEPMVDSLGGYFPRVEYDDLVEDVIAGLQRSVEVALKAGVQQDKLLVDPGIGFGKTPEQNLELLRRLAELRRLGLPILVGHSRKSFIGRVLGVPVEQRLLGTLAVTALVVAAGVDVVRVHDVAESVQVVRMADAIVRGGVAGRSPGPAQGMPGPRRP